MSHLSRAGLRRIFSMKVFWILLLGTNVIYGIYSAFEKYTFYLYHYLTFALLPAYIVSTVLTVYMIHQDFHSGTIRNKLISGNSRRSLYYSWITVSFAMSLIMYSTLLITTLCVGMAKEHVFTTEGVQASDFAIVLILSVLILLGNAAISTFLTAAGRSRSLIAPIVINLLLLGVVYGMVFLYKVISSGNLSYYDHFYKIVFFAVLYATPGGECYRATIGPSMNRWNDLYEQCKPESIIGFSLLIIFTATVIWRGVQLFKKRDIE